MNEQAIYKEIISKAGIIAKEVYRGKDIMITKTANGIVIKKMTVQKV